MTYKELFTNYKIIRQISLLQFVAYFGAWFTNVAIYSMLIEFKATSFMIALVAAMHLFPAVILAPFSGSIVDRFDLKKLMLILLTIELSMTLCFGFINSLEDIWMLLIFLFIRMGSASIFFTTEMTLMPQLIPEEVLVKANEVHSIIWSFTFTAGVALGGLIVDLFGIKISFLIDGAFFFTAIILLTQINFNLKPKKITISISKSIKEGILYLKDNRYIFHFMFLHASVGFIAFDTIITLLANYSYKYIISVPLAIGLTNSTRAFALMIGPLFISKWVNKQNLFYIFIIQGSTIILWAFLQDKFYFGLFGIFLTGITTTTLWSFTYAVLQEHIKKRYLGRILAYNEMFFMLTTVLTTLFIGIMTSYISLTSITSILGFAFIITAYYYRNILSKER